MEQLKMYWKNDDTEAKKPEFPDGMELVSFSKLENAEREWLDIMSYGSLLPEERDPNVNYYLDSMNLNHYSDDLCFFIKVNGKCAASITVVCNPESKEGLIHMVGAKPEFRGLGLGNLMCDVALWTLKKEGMKTARLKTDDRRIPAIKSYLKIGFTPDVTSELDYKERWDKIFEIIKK